MDTKETLWFVYDGECPLCQMGASLYDVKQSVGTVVTIDARTEQDHPVMKEVNDAHLNVDEGMVIKYKDRLYQGAEALHLMATLGADDRLVNRINNTLYQSKTVANFCYPFMKGARHIALFMKGVGNIDNLKTNTSDKEYDK